MPPAAPSAPYSHNLSWEVSSSAPLGPHLLALCFFLAVAAPPGDILAACPGLLPSQLTQLQLNRIVLDRAKEFRRKYFGEDAGDQFQAHLPKAFEIMMRVLNDKSGELKLKEQFEAAKWLMEKVTGKARQELELQAGGTLLQFMKTLEGMREEREASAASVIDVTKQLKAPERKDAIDTWIDKHVPWETK